MINLQTQASNYVILPTSVDNIDSSVFAISMDVNFEKVFIPLFYVDGNSQNTKFATDYIDVAHQGTRECNVTQSYEDGTSKIIYTSIININDIV